MVEGLAKELMVIFPDAIARHPPIANFVPETKKP
jgi:hypothetical protein